MMSSVVSFAYFTHFSNFFGTNADICRYFANGEWHFYSFMEFYMMHSKNQGVKV